jgi:hypothetical protein
LDSDALDDSFSWDSEQSILTLSLGGADLDTGSSLVQLVIYSDLWPDGVVWIHPTRTPDKLRLVTIVED